MPSRVRDDRIMADVSNGTKFKLWGWAKLQREASRAVILHCVEAAREEGAIADYVSTRKPPTRKFLKGHYTKLLVRAKAQTICDILKSKVNGGRRSAGVEMA